MKDLNNQLCIWIDLVLQKSVGLADKWTVNITGEELRLKFKDERKKNKRTHKNNSQAKPVCEETESSPLWVKGR